MTAFGTGVKFQGSVEQRPQLRFSLSRRAVRRGRCPDR